VEDELRRLGWTQVELAEEIGMERHHLSATLNGYRARLDGETLLLIAQTTGSAVLRLLAHGTTVSPLIFRGVDLNLVNAMIVARRECEEAIDAINDALDDVINRDSIDDNSEAERNSIMYALEQMADVNYAADHMDLAAANYGCDLEERNRRVRRKYDGRGYEPLLASRNGGAEEVAM